MESTLGGDTKFVNTGEWGDCGWPFSCRSQSNEEIRPLYCRMCYECKSQCPKGVPVTDELRILAYSDFGGSFPQARGSFRSLPKEIQAIRCSDCASCAIECPNGVEVQNRLIRAQEFLA